MDLPASYYGKLDKRNPVISAFERDINSFMSLMRRVVSSTSQDSNSSYAKGIQILVEIWRKYKHRLPSVMYQERMLQIADFLFGIKGGGPWPELVAVLSKISVWQLYQLALWQGYALHLLQFTTVKITDITDVDHFMACFFPEGFDTDEDAFTMKTRAMQGSALCIFELEKRHSILSQKGLCKLLRVLNFIRIMMQAFQQHEPLCWQLYNGSVHIYTICRYLMSMNCSAQALEYLVWASISLELSIPLMTAKYVPWIVTLYCAVCHCYYDNQAAVQAEEFSRRALSKINELAKLEEQSEVPATRETQRAYKEASIKLGVMVFKRAVYEARRRPKAVFRVKAKSSLKDISNVPWPRTTTERMLMGLFDNTAAQFLCILEAVWDSTRRPLQMRLPDEPELQDVVLELLSAGISILSGVTTTSEHRCDDQPHMSLSALTPTSTLMDLAITGENKVPIMSAVRFIKLLYQCKESEAFTELAREMLQVLSGVEGQSFRKAEAELALIDSFNCLLSSQRSRPKDDNVTDDRHMSSFSMSDELICVVDTLHKSVSGCAPEVQPDRDLVLDVVLFLWAKMKVVMHTDQLQNPELTNDLEKVENFDKWLWCLSRLCEVAIASDLETVDCIMSAEMIHTLVILLERAAEGSNEAQCPALEADSDGVKPSSFSLPESSSTEILQRVCELVRKGLKALATGVATLLPQDSSAITDSAFMQKFCPLPPSTPSISCLATSEEEDKINKTEKEEVETKADSDMNVTRDTQSTRVILLATDLHLELYIILHRASLKLLQLNAVAESELLDQIKKNKVSKALFLVQKALLEHHSNGPNQSNKTKSLLEEASILIEKAGIEERKLHITTTSKTSAEKKDKGLREEEEGPPPPPILLSRTEHSFTFAPAPYNLEGQVFWYQLCGRAADGINQKVRLGDCSLSGTGNMVPAVSGRCVLSVEGLVPNQKYVFAVAAYNSQGKLLGNTIGATTFPLLASMPVPLLSTWAHFAQVAFRTGQYALAKRACKELWSHYTIPDTESHSTQDGLSTTRLQKETLQSSSAHLCQLFLTSIFIETDINIQQGSLFCDSFSDNGPFIWEQEARLAECERMLVAMDLAMSLNDGVAAVQAVVNCYGLLAPIIFHQILCNPAIEVLKKCLVVLEENAGLLKQKWTGNVSESFMHMIACIAYYLSKTLRALKEHEMAFTVMDCSRRLLQEVYDAQWHIKSHANEAVGVKRSAKSKTDHSARVKGEVKISLQLKALYAKNNKKITHGAALTTDNEISRPLTSSEDPTMLYELISSSTLNEAYQDVMKVRRSAYFIEYATVLLQRTMEEGHPDLVLKWGQSIFEFLSRRDEMMGLSTGTEGNSDRKRRHSVQTPRGNEPPQNKNTLCLDDTRKKIKQNIPHSILQRVKTNREIHVVENLITMLSSMARRRKKQLQQRNICCEERVWRSHLNYIMAQAHLTLLYQSLDQMHGGALQHRYSQLNPLCFSLAYSGVLVQRNSQQPKSSKDELVPQKDSSHSGLRNSVTTHNNRHKQEAVRNDDSTSDESDEEEEDPAQPVEQQIETQRRTAALLLDSLNKAASHLRRAMVLAHRGSHWNTLQYVCQTVWDQNCRTALMVQTAVQFEPHSPVIAEELSTAFTQLLVLATDLIMDMLNRLGLWSLYDSDLTEVELESSLHFSAPLDDGTQVDMRWVRSLVLHTLERLHDNGKWETLAHFALLFNSYTRERYSLVTTPLLIHAQRKLLERISSFGGPAVPQPHHIKTQKATGTEVTYRSYAGCQLLSGWTPHQEKRLPIHKKAALTNSNPQHAVELKGAEKQHSMCLVCVPLDVEDTLGWYQQALGRRPHCLQVFQHSRSLLLLHLAYTQPCFAAQPWHCQSRSFHSASLVDFSHTVVHTPTIQPCDLAEEDFTSPDALYGRPISSDHMKTVSAAHSASIKYLQANNHDSLRVLALHDLGNLHFYNGNTRAAHSCWSKAVDCALHSPGAVEKWDGVSFGSASLQDALKQFGVWGCLQAAGLTAKIAQYILTSDISQRTKCCLFSSYLFKCVLCCSLAQPQADLQYASHNVGDELLPGVALFSEPHRVHLGTTVTSLHFVCHWLYTTGYYITILPMLALYLHFVGTVCRDVQRTVEGKILKICALTELCLFTDAARETVQLTQGIGVLLPSGHYIIKDEQPVKTFYSNKSLLDNVEALEELVNCDFAPEVQKLYGSTLCLRLNLARVRLVLALSNSVQGAPVPDTAEDESCSGNSKHHEQDTLDSESSCLKVEEPKLLDLHIENLTLERIKFLLLEGASSLVHSISQQLTFLCCSKTENLELTIESNLLKANLYLQQGHTALSSEMAVSSLVLLQTSPVRTKGFPGSQKPEPELPHLRSASEWGTKHPLHEDCPRAVEAGERIGVYLWLRCRLALVHSLAAHIHDSPAFSPGKNINEETARVIQEGMDECELWGDLDIQALWMVQAAELEAQRGKKDDSMAVLQEAVSLLSGRTYTPPGSSVTLARATLLLSDLRREQSTKLLKLTQKLLQKQLSIFGENVLLDDGKLCFPPPGPSNIYLPYLRILDQTTIKIGQTQDLEMPVSAQSS